MAAVRGFSLTAALSQLTISGAMTAMSAAVGLLFAPLRLATTLFTGMGSAISLLASGAVGALGTAFTALGATIAFAFRALFGIISVVATIGVAMVTLGDKTTIATNTTVTYKDVALAAWNQIASGFGSLVKYVTNLWPSIGDGAKAAFGDADGAFLRFAKSAAYGLDFLRAAFFAAYDTIIEKWRSFPAALVDLIIQAVKKAYQAVVEFMGKVYDFLKDAFMKIISLDFSGIGSGGLDLQVEGAAARVGETWNQALERRLAESTAFRDGLTKTLDEAQKISTERIAKERAELEALNKAREAYKTEGPDKTKLGSDDKMGRKGFADYLKELQREQQLGLAVGDAYKVLNEQINISNKLRRELTDAEKSQIEVAVQANAQLERKRALLQEIQGPGLEYGLQTQALTQLFNEGHISLDQFNQKFYQLRENFLNGLPEATTFADGFAIQIEKMQMATRNGFGQMGTEVAKIFGPGGTLINGIGDAVAQSIVFGKSFKEQIRSIAQSILSQLIGSLVKMGLNMVMNAALGNSLMAASGATTAATMGVITAAATPAAAAVSLATGGANAGAAGTGISSIFALLASLAGSVLGGGKGFSEGGYTGSVSAKDIAGVVHGQEFVINANATRRHRSLLEAINAGKDPMAPIVNAAQPASVNVAITNEIPDAAFEVRPLGESEIEIIAKRIVRQEAAEIVANDLRNPNSRTSRSLSASTYAGRRR